MQIEALLSEIARVHLPSPPASPQEIHAFEQRLGWQLDPDLRAFYLYANGAYLFGRPDFVYRLLPLSEIRRARVAILGQDNDAAGPASWYVVCDNQDSDYVAVDTAKVSNGRYPLFDCWHEGFPDPEECKQIASSFSEFLERALRSQGRLYWLPDGK